MCPKGSLEKHWRTLLTFAARMETVSYVFCIWCQWPKWYVTQSWSFFGPAYRSIPDAAGGQCPLCPAIFSWAPGETHWMKEEKEEEKEIEKLLFSPSGCQGSSSNSSSVTLLNSLNQPLSSTVGPFCTSILFLFIHFQLCDSLWKLLTVQDVWTGKEKKCKNFNTKQTSQD